MKIFFLRYVGDPEFQIGVGENIGVPQTSVSKVVTQVADQMIERWQTKYTFPCAVGVIDCTHIKIKNPPLHADEYINRKGYHSINVQATCNAYMPTTSLEIKQRVSTLMY